MRGDAKCHIEVVLLRIQLACVTLAERRLRAETPFRLVEEYLSRASHYEPCSFSAFASEDDLLAAAGRGAGRARSLLVVLDGTGKLLSSRQFATYLGAARDGGQQQVIAAVGPADGWTDRAKSKADLLLSLGPMTLPHALAQVVVAEQIYRALSILAGHPYHCGH